ncbi:MAG: hypothetical protein AMXMBFR12_10730 [Candidatus Babeliales bacterium]
MQIIKQTLNDFPEGGVALIQDPNKIAVCEYGTNIKSFFILSCPELRPDDINNIYNKSFEYINFNEDSQVALKPIINNKAAIKQPPTFLYNTYNGISNSCLYDITYQAPNSPEASLWVTAILSPKI